MYDVLASRAVVMRSISCAVLLLLSGADSMAMIITNSWTPIFKGIDHATGQMIPDAVDPRLQAVNALRIDLHDPDVQLFTDPPCTNCAPPNETTGLSTSSFLRTYRVQAAVNANFQPLCCFYTDGIQLDVAGLSISQDVALSSPDNATHSSTVSVSTN